MKRVTQKGTWVEDRELKESVVDGETWVMKQGLKEVGIAKGGKESVVIDEKRRTVESWKAAEGVGDNILCIEGAMKGGAEFFEQESSTKNTLCCALSELVSQVLVIDVNIDFGIKKHETELLKGFDHAKWLFFNGDVILLSWI